MCKPCLHTASASGGIHPQVPYRGFAPKPPGYSLQMNIPDATVCSRLTNCAQHISRINYRHISCASLLQITELRRNRSTLIGCMHLLYKQLDSLESGRSFDQSVFCDTDPLTEQFRHQRCNYRCHQGSLLFADMHKPTKLHIHCVSTKVPTFKLYVTLSNLNQFSKFLHCWKAYEIWHTNRMTLPTISPID